MSKNKFFNKLVFNVLLALSMTFVMTLFVTITNFGFTNTFIYKWMLAWLTAFVVALPVVVLISPIVQKNY